MNVSELIHAYRTDPDSPLPSRRLATRRNRDNLLRRIETDHGAVALSEINGRLLRRWHAAWKGPENHVSSAHALIGTLRTLCRFGLTILEDPECIRISTALSNMEFEMGKPRTSQLTSEQADAVRAMAHEMGYPEIALAQALQSSFTLRQGDVIGSWMPLDENWPAHVFTREAKWGCGLLWDNLDENLILRHVTSKRQKPLEWPITLAPVVIEELWNSYPDFVTLDADGKHIYNPTALPVSGAMVICEDTQLPWKDYNFRRKWREIARASGVPDDVYSMDSRSGAITEALRAGAPKEAVRKGAAHAHTAMTDRYDRGDADAVIEVLQKRAEFRLQRAA